MQIIEIDPEKKYIIVMKGNPTTEEKEAFIKDFKEKIRVRGVFFTWEGAQ